MKINIKLIILVIISLLCLLMIFWGYTDDDINSYMPKKAKIINKSLETFNSADPTKTLSGINVFSQKFKYRIQNHYLYKINKKKFYGTFYNNGKNTNFIGSRKEIKKIWASNKIGDSINIFYNKNNIGNSVLFPDKINFGLRYWFCAIILLVIGFFIYWFL